MVCTIRRMNRASGVSPLAGCLVRGVDRDKVAAVRQAMPLEQDGMEAADVFALLGDPGRLRLLVALLEGGEMCVCDLAAAAGMSESSASHAVRWLRPHRIVTAPRRQGRIASYHLAARHPRIPPHLAPPHTP